VLSSLLHFHSIVTLPRKAGGFVLEIGEFLWEGIGALKHDGFYPQRNKDIQLGMK